MRIQSAQIQMLADQVPHVFVIMGDLPFYQEFDMKNIGLVTKVFLLLYAIFFPISVVALEFLLRSLTPFSIFDAELQWKFLFQIMLVDVPVVVIIMTAIVNNLKRKN